MVFPFSRLVGINGAAGLLSMAVLLAACATDSTAVPPADDMLADLIGREAADGPGPDLPPGPPASNFIGQPIAVLERRIGSPALTRREGQNEFRRYDLEYCQAYAIVAPAGGRVQTLTTGPKVAGEAAIEFSRCTAGL